MEIEQEQTVLIQSMRKREQIRHEVRKKSLTEQFNKKRQSFKEPDTFQLLNKLRNNPQELCRVLRIMQEIKLEQNEKTYQLLCELEQIQDSEIKSLCQHLLNRMKELMHK